MAYMPPNMRHGISARSQGLPATSQGLTATFQGLWLWCPVGAGPVVCGFATPLGPNPGAVALLPRWGRTPVLWLCTPFPDLLSYPTVGYAWKFGPYPTKT